MQPILTNDGAHEVSISPDESSLLVRYSYKKNLGNYMLQVTRYLFGPNYIIVNRSFKTYSWREPEVITFKAQDGTTVHARLYKPQKANANKAAILFVHGAGYLQNAHKLE
jgi:dipeptidyl aminopeptidase/acylaminoacyl peptidase